MQIQLFHPYFNQTLFFFLVCMLLSYMTLIYISDFNPDNDFNFCRLPFHFIYYAFWIDNLLFTLTVIIDS